MHKSGGVIGFWSATMLGIGAMVGAGIFALLGEASAIAGSAVYLSFIAGGVIALASAYSFAKLGARYPSAGGIVEYLVQAFGVGLFSGTMSIVFYIGQLVSLALIAQAFGSYASALFVGHASRLWVDTFGTGIVALFAVVNLWGASNLAVIENIIVTLKLVALAAFAVAGMAYLRPALLSPADYPSAGDIAASIGITFFAYEGFRVVTNAAEDMSDPARTLPRAILAAVATVMVLYVVLAIVVFGNLPVADVERARDYALAEAARPVFGAAGFTIVVISALVATASAINANLFATTNITYQLAKDGELPQAFGQPIAHSREGLLISSAIIIALVLTLSLAEIAVIGSITVLFVHGVNHLGHLWKLRRETGASLIVLIFAVVSIFAVIGVVLNYELHRSSRIVTYIGGFFLLGFVLELALFRLRKRTITPRTPE